MTTINLSTTNLNDYTVEDLKTLKAAALQHAQDVAVEYMDTHGEHAYCGFAWVNIYGIKGNTKLGKRMKAAGIEKDYSGGAVGEAGGVCGAGGRRGGGRGGG